MSDSESSRSSRSNFSRDSARDSSVDSRCSKSCSWMEIGEFDDINEANDFIKFNIHKNSTRNSTKPYCVFFDSCVIAVIVHSWRYLCNKISF